VRAALADKIELRLGPALDLLRALPREPLFDIGFIDADKANQLRYYQEVLPRLRSGGLLLIDNVLRDGQVVDQRQSDPSLQAVRACNDAVAADPRVEVVMLPIADGLSVIRKH
jgi:caffeoyl-CoA O-methyltransferase